jgi:hypothetical protein
MRVIHLRRRRVNGYVQQLLAGLARVAGWAIQNALLGCNGAAIQVIRSASSQLAAGVGSPGMSVIARHPAAIQVFCLCILILQVDRGVAIVGK